jgi:hypothetical protein
MVFKNKVVSEDVLDLQRKHYEARENSIICNLQNNIRVIKSRRLRWAGNITYTEQIRNACNILVRNPKEKRSLGRPTHGWKNIKYKS